MGTVIKVIKITVAAGQAALTVISLVKQIKDFLNSKTSYSNSVLQKIFQLLGQTFRRAVDRNYINKNVFNINI